MELYESTIMRKAFVEITSRQSCYFISLNILYINLNNKHTKPTENSTIQLFESHYQKKYLVQVGRFLVHPPQNLSPVTFLRH